MTVRPPAKGAEIVLRQVWHYKGPPLYGYVHGVRVMATKHIRATVVYVRRRGDFDVETPGTEERGGGKYRVRPSGDASGYARGDLSALRWRGEWLHPDQLPEFLEAEARRQ